MAFEIRSEEHSEFLFLHVAGQVTGESILELGGEIRSRCEESSSHRVMIDCSGMTGALSVAEMVSITPKFVKTVGPLIRVAYINAPDEWKPEDDQLSRDIAYNRGGMLEIFASEAEAADWLRRPNGEED